MATLKQKMDVALALAGGGLARGGYSPETGAQQRVSAVAESDSDSGEVTVSFPEGDPVIVPTLAPVRAGERVIVELQNGKAVVIGKPGWGDELVGYIDTRFDGEGGVTTLIREYEGGVLVGKAPVAPATKSVCALVNADGSFDVVNVTWDVSGDKPEPQTAVVLSRQTANSMSVYVGGSGGSVKRIDFSAEEVDVGEPGAGGISFDVAAVIRASGSPVLIDGSHFILRDQKTHIQGSGYVYLGVPLRIDNGRITGINDLSRLTVDMSMSQLSEPISFVGGTYINHNYAAVACFRQAQGSGSDISASSGTITRIPLNVSMASSVGLSQDTPTLSGGGIRIAKSGTYRISAGVYFITGGTTYNGVYVKKGANGASFANATEVMSWQGKEGNSKPVFGGSQMLQCDEGDVLYLAGRCGGQAGSIDPDNKSTFLLVEFVC